MSSTRDRPSSYYREHRKRCIAAGRCYKCSNKLYRWGMCKKHFNLQEEGRNRRRLEGQVQKTVQDRGHTCSSCGRRGHSANVCERVMQAMKASA